MKYRAITSENFYFVELKNTAKYIEEFGIDNLKENLKVKDILDCKSESNFAKKFLSIKKRLEFLSADLRRELLTCSSSDGRFINLYVILSCERLLLEFADEVLKEKYYTFDYVLRDSEIKNFMKLKKEQSEVIESWSEAGRVKMEVKIKNFFLEAGYLERDKDKNFKILKPVVDETIIEIIKKENSKILKAMLY